MQTIQQWQTLSRRFCFSVTNKLLSLYLKHVLSPHFKRLFLTAQLVPFAHLQHGLPAKFSDDFVK